jgi:hypothetical protein
MTEQKKGQPKKASLNKSHADHTTPGSAPTKISRILSHMLCNHSLNRFEAERLGDHCLHSTISSLAHGYGLSFTRKPEKVPNRFGLPCMVTRYSLPESERTRGRLVLAMLWPGADGSREAA